MLELPESNTLARQLADRLTGRTITKAEAGHSPHGFAFYFGEPEKYAAFLSGARIDGAAANGGMIEVTAGDKHLLFGDGVNLRTIAAGEKRPPKHQLLLEFDDGSAVAGTVQMHGLLYAFPSGANDGNFYYMAARKKPSPLSAEFTKLYFEGLLSELKPSMSAKGFLATEQRIPGLGNGVLQDILFQAGIHPKNKVGGFSSADLDRLYRSVKETLSEMTRKGGRDTEKDLYGNPGGYGTILSAKTWKNPCPVCGGKLIRQAYLGGNVYFCPNCQPQK